LLEQDLADGGGPPVGAEERVLARRAVDGGGLEQLPAEVLFLPVTVLVTVGEPLVTFCREP
jgi:hypothetical protein